MQRSIERVMIETVAYHDPIDYHRLKRLVGDHLDCEYDSERHREALENLKELNMVEQPGMAHEYIHITSEGWSHLGGETSRYNSDVSMVDAPVCSVCKTDALVESRW